MQTPEEQHDPPLRDLDAESAKPWPIFHPLPVQPGTREAMEREHARRGSCRKCGGRMGDGIALMNEMTGEPDDLGGDVVTMSPSGQGRMVPCLKCERCGWSVTKEKRDE